MRFKRLLEKNPFCRLDFPAAFCLSGQGPHGPIKGRQRKERKRPLGRILLGAECRYQKVLGAL